MQLIKGIITIIKQDIIKGLSHCDVWGKYGE